MSDDSIEGWAILELMGHRRLGGYITEVEVAGGSFVRIDVPCTDPAVKTPDATQLYSVAAIYCITPTTEIAARAVRSRPEPVSRWELPAETEDPF